MAPNVSINDDDIEDRSQGQGDNGGRDEADQRSSDAVNITPNDVEAGERRELVETAPNNHPVCVTCVNVQHNA